jgi:thermitase
MRALSQTAHLFARLVTVGAFRSIGIFLSCSTLTFAVASAQAASPSNRVPMMNAVKGRLLVQPRAGLSEHQFDQTLTEHGARRALHIAPINVYVIELPAQADEVAVGKALQRLPIIKFVELDRAIEPTQTPNDPHYANAWHLPKIRANYAWDSAPGDGVTIAILDSGVDASHPDLAPRLVGGWNFQDNNANTADVFGHGTKVAGVAAASGNNGLGTTGVDWRARIMPIRITDAGGYGYDSLIAQGLIWAADHGARIANISFLGVSRSETVLCAAQYMRNKGGVVIVAAGNTGQQQADPPSDLLTAVAATDSDDARPSWASFGDYVSVAAPGVSIWTTTPGGGYAAVSGTSASSAVVAGVYGLMMSANRTLLPHSLDRILFSTAVQQGSPHRDPYNGWGRVDAAAAVKRARQTIESDTQPPVTGLAGPAGVAAKGLVPIDAAASDNVGVARVELYANGALVATDISAPYGFVLDTSSLPNGATALLTRAYDTAGNVATSSILTLAVSNPAVAPMVNITNPQNGVLVTGPVPIKVTASDSNRIAKLSLFINGQEVAVGYGTSLSYLWSGAANGKSPTSYTISARAWDPVGNSSVTSISVSR